MSAMAIYPGDFDRFGFVATGASFTTLSNTRSKCSSGSRLRTPRAVARTRLNCSGLSGVGLGLRGMACYRTFCKNPLMTHDNAIPAIKARMGTPTPNIKKSRRLAVSLAVIAGTNSTDVNPGGGGGRFQPASSMVDGNTENRIAAVPIQTADAMSHNLKNPLFQFNFIPLRLTAQSGPLAGFGSRENLCCRRRSAYGNISCPSIQHECAARGIGTICAARKSRDCERFPSQCYQHGSGQDYSGHHDGDRCAHG